MLPGIHLFHKPVGPTSFDLVRAQRSHVGELALCHGGTLDPFAEGLLLMLVGEATRLMDLLHDLPKTYVVRVAWGRETDTGDLLGKTTFEGDAATLTPERIEAAIGPFLGWQAQTPPATSAKKIGGEPAYRKAHRGEHVELPPSRVFLHSVTWNSHELPRASTVTLVCRGGFYVRSLVAELGRALGCGAHVEALHRAAIGPWEDPGPTGENARIAGRALFTWYRTRELGDRELTQARRGDQLPVGTASLGPPSWSPPEGFPLEPLVRLVQARKFHGVAREKDGRLVPLVMLKRGL